MLFIEATAYPGKGNLTLTGQLGDVMQESAQAALSWVRSHTGQLGVPEDWFEKHDVHIHVPAGAVPKDGPSAGVTMATAIASLIRGEPVADDVGMTGEITLTGQVLPIGGIREKSLAAQRAGLKRVILPRENESDLADLPPETREALTFIPADTIEDVFAAAFATATARPGADGQAARAPGRQAGAVAATRTRSSRAAAGTSCRPSRQPRQRSWCSCRPRRTNVTDRLVLARRPGMSASDPARRHRPDPASRPPVWPATVVIRRRAPARGPKSVARTA